VARRALDVVGSLCGRRPARRERRGTALVRAEAPGSRGAVVDGGAYERVAEAKPPRHLGGAHQIASQQLVQRLERVVLGHPRRCGPHLGLERVTRDRGSFQHAPCAFGEQRELLGQRCCDAPGHLDPESDTLPAPRPSERSDARASCLR
jgi:hypothetical protein